MNGSPSRQRQHRRFIVNLSTDAAGTWLRDISMRGMRILSRHALRMDEVVETGFDTEYGVLQLKGRVVRACRSGAEALPFEYGIELDALDTENGVRLRHYLDSLGEEVDEVSDTPVDSLDLHRLHERIRELERARLQGKRKKKPERSETDAPTAQSPDEAAKPGTAEHIPLIGETPDPFVTNFDFPRFAHLVRLGQPLMPLVEDWFECAHDTDSRMVAEHFAAQFDFQDILKNIDISFDEATIESVLFKFYERHLIDFA